MAASFALPWLALERSATEKFAIALVLVAAAGTAAAAAALLVVRLLSGAPVTARLAAAGLVLMTGTAGLVSAALTLVAVAEHFSEGFPLPILLLITAYAGAASLYNFLTVAGWLLLPLGLPAIAVMTVLIARGRVEDRATVLLWRGRQARRSGA